MKATNEEKKEPYFDVFNHKHSWGVVGSRVMVLYTLWFREWTHILYTLEGFFFSLLNILHKLLKFDFWKTYSEKDI